MNSQGQNTIANANLETGPRPLVNLTCDGPLEELHRSRDERDSFVASLDYGQGERRGNCFAMTDAACISAVVIDPAIQSIGVALIGAVVTIVTVVFAFKTAALNKRIEQHDAKIAEVIKTSDGMKDALVLATGKAERALGVIEGVAKAETKAAIVTAAEAVGAAKAVDNPKTPISPELKSW